MSTVDHIQPKDFQSLVEQDPNLPLMSKWRFSRHSNHCANNVPMNRDAGQVRKNLKLAETPKRFPS